MSQNVIWHLEIGISPSSSVNFTVSKTKVYFPLTKKDCFLSVLKVCICMLVRSQTLETIWQKAAIWNEVDVPVLFIFPCYSFFLLSQNGRQSTVVGWVNCWKACPWTVPGSPQPAVPDHFRGGLIAIWYCVGISSEDGDVHVTLAPRSHLYKKESCSFRNTVYAVWK